MLNIDLNIGIMIKMSLYLMVMPMPMVWMPKDIYLFHQGRMQIKHSAYYCQSQCLLKFLLKFLHLAVKMELIIVTCMFIFTDVPR